MKNKMLKLVGVVIFAMVAISAVAATGEKTFDDYVITPVEKQNLQAGIDQAWVLSYNDNESPIVITLKKDKKCNTYLVRADHFEVAYVCTERGFGARSVKPSESNVPLEFTSQVINYEELARQRILSAAKVDVDMALGLIAAYLPDLVNPSYQHLLN